MGKKKRNGGKNNRENINLCDILEKHQLEDVLIDYYKNKDWDKIVSLAYFLLETEEIKVDRVNTTNNYLRINGKKRNVDVEFTYRIRGGNDKNKTLAMGLLAYSMAKINGVKSVYIRIGKGFTTKHRDVHNASEINEAFGTIDNLVDTCNLEGWQFVDFSPEAEQPKGQITYEAREEFPRYQQLSQPEKQRVRDNIVRFMFKNPDTPVTEIRSYVMNEFGITISPTVVNSLREKARELEVKSYENLKELLKEKIDVPVESQEASLILPLEGGSGAYRLVEELEESYMDDEGNLRLLSTVKYKEVNISLEEE